MHCWNSFINLWGLVRLLTSLNPFFLIFLFHLSFSLWCLTFPLPCVFNPWPVTCGNGRQSGSVSLLSSPPSLCSPRPPAVSVSELRRRWTYTFSLHVRVCISEWRHNRVTSITGLTEHLWGSQTTQHANSIRRSTLWCLCLCSKPYIPSIFMFACMTRACLCLHMCILCCRSEVV